MRLVGTFRPKLDEKGRLFLPAKFRDRLAEGVVLTQGQENCLYVWPPEVFDLEADRAGEMSSTSKAARGYNRIFFAGAEEVTQDKSGRIGIPAHLRDWAGLEKDVVVIGVRNKLEIWNPTTWESYKAEEQQRFADLDEE